MLYKYPKTTHLPWSKGITLDDVKLYDDSFFNNKKVVVTEKMDGENTTMYNNYIHSRSLSSADHESRHYVKNIWSNIKYLIPNNFRICGENLYAKHSIYYNNLESYFLCFSVWLNDKCLSWDDTENFCSNININTVPLLYKGLYNKDKIKKLFNNNMEGYVIRLSDSFLISDFQKSVAKFVRKNHVKTDKHWMHQKIIKNKLTKM